MDGSSTKYRLVRCPKCLKLLVEYADIPVYPCGGCGTTLRVKNRTPAGENVNSRSLEADHSQSLSDIGSLDDGSTSSVKQMFACSTSAHSSELEHEEKETILPNIHSPYSGAKCNHQENGETSGEIGIQENGSDTNQLAVRSDASQSQPDEGVHSKTEAEKSLKLSQQSSNVMNKVEEPPESVGRSVASQEDMVERGSTTALDLSFRSPATRSSHAYDGSISSSDDGYNKRSRDKYLRLSRRTYRQPKALDSADNKGKEGGEVSRSNQKTIDVEADLQARTLSSKLPNERHDSGIMGMHELSRETSFGSEDFHSVQNSMEPENDGPPRSVSRGSDFQHDFLNSKSSKYLRMDLLRKMFELKYQLHGLCDQSVEGRKPYLRGNDGQQPLYQKSEHQPPQYLNSNLIHHPPEAIYGPRQVTFRRHQFSQMPSSAQRCCSCLHCCLDDQLLQLQPNHCTDGTCRAHAYKLCCHSSTAGSSGTPEHEQEKLRYNEIMKRKKNHCRPIFGGAPFVICYNCFELLQLPADFLISRRRPNKLQCTSCSEVLELSFPSIANFSPWSPSKVVDPCDKVSNCADVATGSVSHSNDCSRSDAASFSEVCGLSSTKSFSTEDKPVVHVSRNSSQGKYDKQKSGLPLHRLMGYSSASELLYQYWDFDEGYESIESMVPHSYRPWESHVIDGLRAKGKTTSCHKQIGPCTDPDCMEIHEEEESPQPL